MVLKVVKIFFAIVLPLAAWVLGLECAAQKWQAIRMVEWKVERQLALRSLGARIRRYAEDRDRVLPSSFEKLVEAGIMAPEEIRSISTGTLIERRLRPIPSLDSPSKLILVYEVYRDAYHGYGSYVSLDGVACSMGRELTEIIAADNELRRANGLSELPP